ncbi:MAG TPA: hypothetical protein VF275_07940 [Gammaproteobacteria bacterium]
MCRFLLSLIALLCAASPAMTEESHVLQRTGIAYAVGSNTMLYREIHETRWRDGLPVTETVIYRDTDGDLLATKTIDYRTSLQAPSFRLVMEGIDYEEGLERTESGLRAFVPPIGETMQTAPVKEGDDLVVDGGFDRLIFRKLDAIKAGETLSFRFLIPGRLESYDFRVRKVADGEMLGEAAVHIRLEPANFLLRWLAEPVNVWYHRDSGRLLRYIGPSNLRDPDGNNPNVRVDFPGSPVVVKPEPGEAS